MKEIIKFPKGFLFGSGTSAIQIEPNGTKQQGNKEVDTFMNSYLKNKDKFYDGKYTINNFYEKYEEDLQLAKEIGFDSIRLQISWARLIPNGVDIDEGAIKYYKNVFQSAKGNNLALTITLYHFDMPQWAGNLGGWRNKEVIEKFVFFAKTSFELFDEYADYWAIFNESLADVSARYGISKFPQFKGTNEFKNAPQAIWGINLCVAKIVKVHKELKLSTPIGNIFVASYIKAISDNNDDIIAEKFAEDYLIRMYSDPNILGTFPQLILDFWEEKGIKLDITQEDLELIKNNTIEWAGLNYYSPIRVGKPNVIDLERDEIIGFGMEEKCKVHVNLKDRFNTDRGWEIYPKGIYEIIMKFDKWYNGIPTMITENGVAVMEENRFKDENGIIQDKYREQFVKEHLWWINKAISDGAKSLGYQMWTYIDNWSFDNAYKNRYGFIELNVDTGERIKKASTIWTKKFGKTKSFSFDYDEVLKNDVLQKSFKTKKEDVYFT